MKKKHGYFFSRNGFTVGWLQQASPSGAGVPLRCSGTMSTQDKDSSHFQKIQVHCVLILGKHKCNIGETWKTCGYIWIYTQSSKNHASTWPSKSLHMCPFCTGLQEERPGRVRIPYLRPHGSHYSHSYPPFFGRCSCGTPKKISCLGRSPLSRLGSGGYVAQNQRKENFVAPWHSRILWKRTGMRGMVLETYWYWHHSTWLEAWSRSSPIYGIFMVSGVGSYNSKFCWPCSFAELFVDAGCLNLFSYLLFICQVTKCEHLRIC